tara:strand:- start:4710 stop:7688 length:2979 start_codon:yes stop_codon:yes gene_type:complete
MPELLTMQDLANGHLDVKALGEAANGDENTIVTTRTGNTYPSAERAINIMFKNGGLPATPFATKALMTASSLANDKYAMVTDDTANNGLYVKAGGVWVKSAYDPLAKAIDYSNANKIDVRDLEFAYSGGNLVGELSLRYVNYGIDNAFTAKPTPYYDCIVIPVDEKFKLTIHNNVNAFNYPNNANFIFTSKKPSPNAVEDRILYTTLESGTDTATGISYTQVEVPANAKYLILNTRFTSASGDRKDFVWSVHEGDFNPSYEAKRLYVSKVKDIYLDKNQVPQEALYKPSIKNLFNGKFVRKIRMFDGAAVYNQDLDAVIAEPIPVENGKTYTISGVNSRLLGSGVFYVQGFSSNGNLQVSFVKTLYVGFSTSPTVTIDNPNIKYISFSLSNVGFGTFEEVQKLRIQVELGGVATNYEPVTTNKIITDIYKAIEEKKVQKPLTKILTNYTILNKVRVPKITTLKQVEIAPSSMGVSYSVKGEEGLVDSGNSLFTKVELNGTGRQSLNIHLMNLVNGTRIIGKIDRIKVLDTPSGSLDNDGGLNIENTYPKNLYTHPDIAYSDTPVAGFKYWMIASIFPPYDKGDALWEDEDIFVSNDAENWQRIRSIYEPDKSYTHPTLRLPPQALVTKNSRKHAFIPSPSVGDTVEISVDTTGSRPAVDREMITLTALPWKHDPFILIDGGYVYTYTTFHLPSLKYDADYAGFIVCVRTNNGIDWDVVRNDGSTMRLTEETSKLLFTKDSQGRNNYMYCKGQYVSGQNPTVIKFGDNDYHFYYGYQNEYFSKGTTPYSFDFSKKTSTSGIGYTPSNHPCLWYTDGVLYLLTNSDLFSSTNRGVNFTKENYYPNWNGGVTGEQYKQSVCIGEGGKVVLVAAQNLFLPQESLAPINGTNLSGRVSQAIIRTYPSMSDYLSHARTLIDDAYVDIEIAQINYQNRTREIYFIPAVSCKATGYGGTNVTQRIKLTDIDVADGDVLYIYTALNSRGSGEILFGGFDLT